MHGNTQQPPDYPTPKPAGDAIQRICSWYRVWSEIHATGKKGPETERHFRLMCEIDRPEKPISIRARLNDLIWKAQMNGTVEENMQRCGRAINIKVSSSLDTGRGH